MRFNPDKFQFKVKEASVFGLTWTTDGIRPGETKIKAIRDMPSPKNLTELQCFLGMINYLKTFSPILAQVSEPVRQLTPVGCLKSLTITCLVRRWSSKPTTSHTKVSGRRAYQALHHAFRGSYLKWPNTTWRSGTVKEKAT